MYKEIAATNSIVRAPFVFASKPTVPVATKNSFRSKYFDPSASLPHGRSYPVPCSFDYRVKPNDHME